jgi:hypothetical protein
MNFWASRLSLNYFAKPAEVDSSRHWLQLSRLTPVAVPPRMPVDGGLSPSNTPGAASARAHAASGMSILGEAGGRARGPLLYLGDRAAGRMLELGR